MKARLIFSIILLIGLQLSITAQEKTVIVSKTPKVVPQGENWILEIGDRIEFQVSENCFSRKSMCSQYFSENVILLLSNGRLIPYYNVFEAKDSYVIALENIEETMNGYSAIIKELGEISKLGNDNELDKPIIFNEGENVAITKDCLLKITMKRVKKE